MAASGIKQTAFFEQINVHQIGFSVFVWIDENLSSSSTSASFFLTLLFSYCLSRWLLSFRKGLNLWLKPSCPSLLWLWWPPWHWFMSTLLAINYLLKGQLMTKENSYSYNYSLSSLSSLCLFDRPPQLLDIFLAIFFSFVMLILITKLNIVLTRSEPQFYSLLTRFE